MGILVTYEDGTTEERDADSPCIANIFEPRLRHPSEERWYLYFPDAHPPLSFCAHSVRALRDWRGEALVWRITGQDPETKALIGLWEACRVETVDEQIERLARERDAKKARAARWKKAARRLRWWAQDEARGAAHLQRGAQAMLAVLRPGEDTTWKPSSIAADLVVWAEHVAALAARADAAEKRLADLRAWAEEIANGQSDTPEGRRVAGDFRAVVYRIDDKEAP